MNIVGQNQETLGAGAIIDNVCAGTNVERCPFPAAVATFWGTADVVSTCSMEITVGERRICQPVWLSGANHMPLWNEDIIIGGVEVLGNQLIQVTLRDSGAASVAFWRVSLEEANLRVAG